MLELSPGAGSGFRMEIYGREGTLVATGSVSSQRGEMLRVQGARGSHELQDLDIPERFVYVPPDFPRGDPFNVGQMYTLFAEAVRTGQNRLPTFDVAVDLHRFIDTIKQASDHGPGVAGCLRRLFSKPRNTLATRNHKRPGTRVRPVT